MRWETLEIGIVNCEILEDEEAKEGGGVMNRDTRTFLFSVVSIFTFLFLEWTYIIGEVT